jgi:hypothetical protein
MGKYLKMSDVFNAAVVASKNDDAMTLNDGAFGGFELAEFYNMDECQYAAHAINYHDELVAEVERLRCEVFYLNDRLEKHVEKMIGRSNI